MSFLDREEIDAFAEAAGADYNTVRAKITNDRAKARKLGNERRQAMNMK